MPEWRNWQTRGTQNPERVTPRVGSIPTSGTIPSKTPSWYGYPVPHRRYAAAFRALALALLATIAGDLLDAACDPLPPDSQTATLSAQSDVDADAEQCAGICVADCYCCCAVDGPTADAVRGPLGFLRMATDLIPPRGPSRTTAPLDQPPTRL